MATTTDELDIENCFTKLYNRVVDGSDGPAGRVGSGRVGSRFCRILSGRVSTSGFLDFILIISWFLNRYESSNNTFGLIISLYDI